MPMRKLRLDPDALAIESFPTLPDPVEDAGTVHAAALAVTGLTCTCYGKPTCVATCNTSCYGDGVCTCRPP